MIEVIELILNAPVAKVFGLLSYHSIYEKYLCLSIVRLPRLFSLCTIQALDFICLTDTVKRPQKKYLLLFFLRL